MFPFPIIIRVNHRLEGYTVQNPVRVCVSLYLMFSLSTLRIAAVIGIYWITSWSAIFLNKLEMMLLRVLIA